MIWILLTAVIATTPLADNLKRPALTIPQGIVESGLNTKARGKAGEKGAWQVREKYHGKVPKRLIDQGKQAEKILDELLKTTEGDMLKALSRYNGSGKAADRYAAKVRQRAFQYHFIV